MIVTRILSLEKKREVDRGNESFRGEWGGGEIFTL